MRRLTLQIEPIPPFRLDLTVWALKRREENTWDGWYGETYRRVMVIDGTPAEVAVTQTSGIDAPRLAVTVMTSGDTRAVGLEKATAYSLRRLLGTGTDLTVFYGLASKDPRLGPLASRLRGLKPPRYPDLFEALTNAITCQQITLTQGLRILGRLIDLYGVPFQGAEGTTHAFPRPEDILHATTEDLRSIGYSRQKARALLELATAMTSSSSSLDGLEALDDTEAAARLRTLHGVGRWTAEYVLLRGLGRTHIFPGDDVGIRRRLERWLDPERSLDYSGVRDVLAEWAPYGGLVYLHLLVDGLVNSGMLDI